jgi:hypothetical protein
METYQVGRHLRKGTAFVDTMFVVILLVPLVAALRTPSINGVVLPVAFVVALTAHAWWIYLRLVYRVETDDREIRFISRSGCVAVAWSKLRSVKAGRAQRSRLDWEFDGGSVYTFGEIDREEHFLFALTQHAPGVTIEGRRPLP